MPLDRISKACRERMQKSVDHLDRELRGIRTGRASTSLVEYIKVECYGGSMDLREVASVSVPEPTKLMIKPFDPGVRAEIVRAIETANLGLNPQVDTDAIRINVPPPSSERRAQLISQVKKMAEDTRVAIRNERRDAVKQIDAAVKDKNNHLSEDSGKTAKDAIETHTKHFSKLVDEHAARKAQEIEEV